MAKPKVLIVILNWNRIDLTRDCIGSLTKQSYKDFDIVVVDNGSSDNSVDWLSKQKNLSLILNEKNQGFAKAVNQGFAKAVNSDYVYAVSLNNDAVVSSDWLEKLVAYMDQNVSISFAQGASMQKDSPKLYDSTGIYLERGLIPNQRAIGSTKPSLEISAIGPNAAGAIYRTSMLKQVQIKDGEYFDNSFFAYVEDVDFNLRCTLRGFKFGYVPQAKLYHIGSATGNSIAKKKMYWGARNLVWLGYKNCSSSMYRRLFSIILKSHLANLQFLWREQRANFFPYLKGLTIGILLLPRQARKRKVNLRLQKITDNEFYGLLLPSSPPLHNPFRKLINLLK